MRNETAEIKVEKVAVQGSTLTAEVRVANNTGHSFPSGVSFRRAFIEFLVLNNQGNPIWASGRTSDLGVILNGTTEQPLRTELMPGGGGPNPGVCQESPNYQVHHATVTRPDRVQIYEELLQDVATTLHHQLSSPLPDCEGQSVTAAGVAIGRALWQGDRPGGRVYPAGSRLCQ